MIVSGRNLTKTMMFNTFLNVLKKEVEVFVFDNVYSNPTISNVEEGVSFYNQNNCEGIVAYDSGLSINCTKVIATRINNPNISVNKMKGFLRIKHNPVF